MIEKWFALAALALICSGIAKLIYDLYKDYPR